MENQGFRDYKNIRAYHKKLFALRNKSDKTVDDVHEEKQLERELLDECKRYYDRHERDQKTLPIVYKADPKNKNGKDDVISEYDAENILGGFPDLKAELQEYIRKPSPSASLPIEEKSSTLPTPAIRGQITEEENYVFKKAGLGLKGKIRWEIVYKGMKLPELEYKGLMYVQYYMKHPDDKLFNWEIEQILEPGMPVETKRPNIDFKEDKDGRMRADGLQIVGVEGLEGFQPIGDRQALKQCLKEIVGLEGEIKNAEDEGDFALKSELDGKLSLMLKQKDEIIQKGEYKGFENQTTKRIDGRIRGSMDELLRNLKGMKGSGAQEFADHLEKSLKPSYSSHSRKWYSPSSSIKWDFGDD